jgi:hypothetical protein
MSIKKGDPILDKLAVLTPVYVVGLMGIFEMVIQFMHDSPPMERFFTTFILVAIALLATLYVELIRRNLWAEGRKAQFVVAFVSASLFIAISTLRFLGFDLVAIPGGPLLFGLSGFWTILAPLCVDYDEVDGEDKWRFHPIRNKKTDGD